MRSMILLWILIVCSLGRAEAPQGDVRLEIGEKAPLFMLQDFSSNEWVSLRDYCGDLRQSWKNGTKKFVLVNFWATYCAPCKKEIPEIERMAAGFGDSLKVLLVSIDPEGSRIIDPYMKVQKCRSTVLLDPYQRAAAKYLIQGVPALFLIDREGTIIYSSYGYSPKAIREVGALLTKQLSRKAPK